MIQGTIYRGWVKVKKGNVAEGILLLRSGLAAYRATGAELLIPHHFAVLAGACEIAGQIEEAMTLLDDGLRAIERTGERWLAAELTRHKGELLVRQGHIEAAEELYRKALALPLSRRPNSGNCAPPRASPGCVAITAITPKLATFSRRFMPGSPRVSIRPTCKQPGHCLTNSVRGRLAVRKSC
jgi:tetratricopeptide (TPR) repeat protein